MSSTLEIILWILMLWPISLLQRSVLKMVSLIIVSRLKMFLSFLFKFSIRGFFVSFLLFLVMHHFFLACSFVFYQRYFFLLPCVFSFSQKVKKSPFIWWISFLLFFDRFLYLIPVLWLVVFWYNFITLCYNNLLQTAHDQCRTSCRCKYFFKHNLA